MSTATVAPSRRSVMAGVGAGTAVVAATAVAAPAQAAKARYTPASYTGVKLLPEAERHLVSRFSYGVTPALANQVRKAGGAQAWFERQLTPSAVGDGTAAGFDSWWPSLSYDAAKLWERSQGTLEGGWEVMQSYQRWLLMRRTYSQRQLSEVMTEFWENHFNVPVFGDGVFTFRKSYGDVIRSKALGSFEDLLQSVIVHPAMGMFLDNARSSKSAPNENLGRELLELHTVGRGTYDEDDVKSSARILTGYWVDMWRTWNASYRPEEHWTGRVDVMEFGDDNRDPDGRGVVRRYLSYLANHPATATRIARKLAVKFVSDSPSEALVAHLAEVYRRNDTAIAPVLRALVATSEFKRSAGKKVRDPGEDLVATYRVLQMKVGRPTASDSAVNAMLWQVANLGQTPVSWPQPDGPPLTGEAWSSPSRILASFDNHYALSGGWWPKKDVTYRPKEKWVPKFPIRFDLLVDYLSRQLLHRPSDAALLEACCLSVGLTPGERIHRDHGLVKWNMHRVLCTVLDSPAHLTR
ncbi:DUF1800 domain-containing protein [uncultured Nocardioides sp.]|uniref:DUF1800 domain-containing protein n=1 Tax=uncultured Nocardioides sp. TaxID=198441 RepID=UPI0026066130|nr:DUF1800 domain-containing protein [uncultured Nocardioides sp.]